MGSNANLNSKLHKPENMRAMMEMTLALFLGISHGTAEVFLAKHEYDLRAAMADVTDQRARGVL